MALKSLNNETPQQVMALGRIAEAVRRRLDNARERQGGITPEQLQSLAGEYLSQSAAGRDRDQYVHVFLSMLAAHWPEVVNGTSKMTEQEFGATLILLGLWLGEMCIFDGYQAAFEQLDDWLDSAITAGQKAMEVSDAEA